MGIHKNKRSARVSKQRPSKEVADGKPTNDSTSSSKRLKRTGTADLGNDKSRMHGKRKTKGKSSDELDISFVPKNFKNNGLDKRKQKEKVMKTKSVKTGKQIAGNRQKARSNRDKSASDQECSKRTTVPTISKKGGIEKGSGKAKVVKAGDQTKDTGVGESKYPCNDCEKIYSSIGSLRSHTRVHNPKQHRCDVCGRYFRSLRWLKKHAIIHTDDSPYKCPICSTLFKNNDRYTIHYRTHSDHKPYHCDICGKRFRISGNLKLHKKVHAPEKAFKCDICNKEFSSNKGLISHVLTHSEGQIFKCTQCGKIFGRQDHYVKHQETHTKVRPFSCDVCGQTYQNNTDLKCHLGTHADNQGFVCHFCGKGFGYKSSLTYHLRIHTGAKPYACDVCGKTFSTSSNRCKHMLSHTNFKPFKCDRCGKCFRDNRSLVLHERRHTGYRPHQCTTCLRSFIVRSELNRHRSKTHSQPPNTDQYQKDSGTTDANNTGPKVNDTDVFAEHSMEKSGSAYSATVTSDCVGAKSGLHLSQGNSAISANTSVNSIYSHIPVSSDNSSINVVSNNTDNSGFDRHRYLDHTDSFPSNIAMCVHDVGDSDVAMYGTSQILQYELPLHTNTALPPYQQVVVVPWLASDDSESHSLNTTELALPLQNHRDDNTSSTSQMVSESYHSGQVISASWSVPHSSYDYKSSASQTESQGYHSILGSSASPGELHSHPHLLAVTNVSALAMHNLSPNQDLSQNQNQHIINNETVSHIKPPIAESHEETRDVSSTTAKVDKGESTLIKPSKSEGHEEKRDVSPTTEQVEKGEIKVMLATDGNCIDHTGQELTIGILQPAVLETDFSPPGGNLGDDTPRDLDTTNVDDNEVDYHMDVDTDDEYQWDKEVDAYSTLDDANSCSRTDVTKESKENTNAILKNTSDLKELEQVPTSKNIADRVSNSKGGTVNTKSKYNKNRSKIKRTHKTTNAKTGNSKTTIKTTSRGKNKEVLSCKLCSRTFLYKASFASHKKRHRTQSKLTCKSCDKSFNNIHRLENHMKVHDQVDETDAKFKCDACDKVYNSKNSLQSHVKIHKPREHTCQICHRDFRRPSFLKRHLKVHTDENPYRCQYCGKDFTRTDQLKNHLRKHTGHKPYQCDICGMRFTQNGNLNSHAKQHAPEKAFTCDDCGAEYKDNSELISHIISHGRGANKCSVCGKLFGRRDHLLNHANIHSGDRRPFPCAFCDQRFLNGTDCKIHEKIHTNDKSFSCEYCGKCFRHKSGLTYHIRTHTGAKPYSCKICGKAFRTNSYLHKHTMFHTGYRPYKCEYCDKAFTCTADLVVHTRTHTGERPYPCSVCQKTFKESIAMKRHLISMHTCTICGNTFLEKAELIKHITSHNALNVQVPS